MIAMDRYTIFVNVEHGDECEGILKARGWKPDEVPVLGHDARCFTLYAFRGLWRRRRVAKDIQQALRFLPATSRVVVYREAITQIIPDRRLNADL